jgi:preprotein translocase subunit SecA
MRVFASDTVKTLMGKLNIAEDEAIENSIITRSLESAQTKIEGFNFDSRKHVLEYDDILNHQRKTVYERRRKILLGSIDEVEEKINEVVGDNEELKKVMTDKSAQLGRETFMATVRQLMLQAIDMFWVEHLEIMDHTRSSVNLRAYGQRDPLVEYKKEGLRLFKEMQIAINDQIINLLPHIGAGVSTPETVQLKAVHEQAQTIGSGDGDDKSQSQEVSKKPEVGRNDLCPCGSGKKYKKCHGANS